MSDDLVNQLTLNFLISKPQLQKLNKKVKETSCEKKNSEMKEYNDRIKKLFNDLLVCNPPDDLLFEVKIAFDTFIEKTIYYFKAHDNTENLEQERSQIIHQDIDYEKEEKDIENGNYKERSNDNEDEEDEQEEEDEEYEDEHEYEDEDEQEDEEKDKEEKDKEEKDEEKEDEQEEDDEKDEEECNNDKLTNEYNKSINHNPIIVKSKYKKPTNSIGVDDIQKLPLNWFDNVRQNYRKNQIIPRKKETTIVEPIFRDVKKKI